MLNALRQLVQLRQGQDAEAHLRSLGADFNEEDWTPTLKAVTRFVLVVVGSSAKDGWHATGLDGVAADHTYAMCNFCLTHAVHGACWHAYVGLRLAGMLDETHVAVPATKKKRRVLKLQPARPAAASAASSSSAAARAPVNFNSRVAKIFERYLASILKDLEACSLAPSKT